MRPRRGAGSPWRPAWARGNAMRSTWLAAVGVELCSTFLNVAGKQCFRQAHVANLKIYYVFAVLLMGISTATSSIAMLLGPNTLVSAIDGMIIVWNILLAPYTLGEPITVGRLTAGIVITFGTCMTAIFGNHHNVLQTPTQYDEAILAWNAVVYYVTFYSMWLSLLYISCRGAYDMKLESRLGGALRSSLAGSIAGGGGLFQKAMVCNLAGERLQVALSTPWVYCLFVFWISAQVSAWVLFATATAHHEALFCLPIYEACLIASSGIMGYVVLHEAVGPAYEVVHEAVGYWLSVTILLSGCYLLVGWPFEWDPNREISQLSCHLRRDQGKKPPPAAEGPKKRPTEASPLVQP